MLFSIIFFVIFLSQAVKGEIGWAAFIRDKPLVFHWRLIVVLHGKFVDVNAVIKNRTLLFSTAPYSVQT